MNPHFLGTAVSRKDGSDADGIHLLWTAPPAAGYSVTGFDIQRRHSRRQPEISCYTLTADELFILHRDFRVETPRARVGVQRALCPQFPERPPDEPFDGGGEPSGDEPGVGEKTCVEFRRFPIAEGPNPRVEQGVRFLVRQHTGAPAPSTRVTGIGALTGLDCGFALEVELPVGATGVELTLAHFSRPAEVEAFNADGSSAGTAVMSAQQGQPQTFHLSGPAISRVLVRAAQDETLLLNFCYESRAARCVDFQKSPDGPDENPKVEGGVIFEAHGHAGCMSLPFGVTSLFTNLQRLTRTEVRTRDKLTGLNCGFELIVTLPAKASTVEATLAHFAEPARLVAFRADGSEVGSATMTAPPGQAETLGIKGEGIERVVITAPRNETLLLKLCYAPGGGGGEDRPTLRPRELAVPLREAGGRAADVARDSIDPARGRADVRANAGGGPDGAAGGRAGEGLSADDVVERPSAFTPAQPLSHPSTFRHSSFTALRVSTHGDQPCIRYDVDLRGQHDLVRIIIGVPVALAIAMRDGKAVDTKFGTDPSGSQEFVFENRRVDRVLIYTTQPAHRLVICVDIPPGPDEEEREWAEVPYIVKGLQLPVRAVNGALGTGADEKNLAASRLLPGEILDDPAFADVAQLLNEAAADADDASPVWYTTLTRERPEDVYIEVRPWPYALSLLAHAAWRRALGFGFFDDGGGLTEGDFYDYRITGRFRYRDLNERLYGFHNVPTGTTLPSSFHLGPLRFNTFVPAVVDIFQPAPAAGLRHTGRKGVALRESFFGRDLSLTFPSPVTRVVLELEPDADHDLRYEARTSDYLFGLPGASSSGVIAPAPRVELVFPEPIDTLTLIGKGFLYGVRVETVPIPAGRTADDLSRQSCIIYGVRYESTPAPEPPPFLGTLNLQQPLIPGDPALTTQNPPRDLGFRLLWLPPPSAGGAGPTPWPPDLAAFPPFDVLAFLIERRRVDTGGPFVEVDGQSPPTMFFGSRSSRREPPQLHYGIDLLEAYPENSPPVPPVSPLMEAEDVLDSAKRREEGPTPPPGSLHRYRIRSVDAIGRRSAAATLGSVVRLEKRVPPPQPVSPSPLAALPAGASQPSGLRARVLQATDPDLTADDRTLLGGNANAVVFEWGWGDEQRAQDPYATEFRVYWQPDPPDVIRGTLTGVPTSVGILYEMSASMGRPVAADAMLGRYIHSGGHAFKVASHTAGQAITVRLHKAEVNPAAVPAAADFEFRPVLRGDELRPAGWPERTAVVPITAARDYRVVFRDRLTLDPTHTRVRVWVGASAADAQTYIADEVPGAEPNGGRPGNESSIASAAAAAHYIGRPTFNVPPPLPDVPEQVTNEPGVENVTVNLDLPALLAGLPVPAGHKIKLERIGFDAVAPLVSAREDDTIGVTLPDGTTETYVLGNPTDHADFLAQIRTGTAGRVENRFLMDFIIRYRTRLEPLWHQSQPDPIPFGAAADVLPNKPERYVHRVRLVDQAGHISEGAALVPQVVRVPSLSPPAAPEFNLPDSGDDQLTVTARVHESHELKWLAVFTHVAAAGEALDERTLEKPQLLRLPNRRDLYPNHGIRLRLRDGTLLAPTTQNVSAGTLQVPDRLLTIPLAPGFDKRVAVWVAAVTRDGITSRFSGPRVAVTGPAPLVPPTLTVTPGASADTASWTPLTAAAETSVERSTDSGASWSRVTPWLAEATTTYDIPRVTTGARRYRLVLRNSSGQTFNGSPVTLA